MNKNTDYNKLEKHLSVYTMHHAYRAFFAGGLELYICGSRLRATNSCGSLLVFDWKCLKILKELS